MVQPRVALSWICSQLGLLIQKNLMDMWQSIVVLDVAVTFRIQEDTGRVSLWSLG